MINEKISDFVINAIDPNTVHKRNLKLENYIFTPNLFTSTSITDQKVLSGINLPRNAHSISELISLKTFGNTSMYAMQSISIDNILTANFGFNKEVSKTLRQYFIYTKKYQGLNIQIYLYLIKTSVLFHFLKQKTLTGLEFEVIYIAVIFAEFTTLILESMNSEQPKKSMNSYEPTRKDSWIPYIIETYVIEYAKTINKISMITAVKRTIKKILDDNATYNKATTAEKAKKAAADATKIVEKEAKAQYDNDTSPYAKADKESIAEATKKATKKAAAKVEKEAKDQYENEADNRIITLMISLVISIYNPIPFDTQVTSKTIPNTIYNTIYYYVALAVATLAFDTTEFDKFYKFDNNISEEIVAEILEAKTKVQNSYTTILNEIALKKVEVAKTIAEDKKKESVRLAIIAEDKKKESVRLAIISRTSMTPETLALLEDKSKALKERDKALAKPQITKLKEITAEYDLEQTGLIIAVEAEKAANILLEKLLKSLPDEATPAALAVKEELELEVKEELELEVKEALARVYAAENKYKETHEKLVKLKDEITQITGNEVYLLEKYAVKEADKKIKKIQLKLYARPEYFDYIEAERALNVAAAATKLVEETEKHLASILETIEILELIVGVQNLQLTALSISIRLSPNPKKTKEEKETILTTIENAIKEKIPKKKTITIKELQKEIQYQTTPTLAVSIYASIYESAKEEETEPYASIYQSSKEKETTITILDKYVNMLVHLNKKYKNIYDIILPRIHNLSNKSYNSVEGSSTPVNKMPLLEGLVIEEDIPNILNLTDKSKECFKLYTYVDTKFNTLMSHYKTNSKTRATLQLPTAIGHCKSEGTYTNILDEVYKNVYKDGVINMHTNLVYNAIFYQLCISSSLEPSQVQEYINSLHLTTSMTNNADTTLYVGYYKASIQFWNISTPPTYDTITKIQCIFPIFSQDGTEVCILLCELKDYVRFLTNKMIRLSNIKNAAYKYMYDALTVIQVLLYENDNESLREKKWYKPYINNELCRRMNQLCTKYTTDEYHMILPCNPFNYYKTKYTTNGLIYISDSKTIKLTIDATDIKGTVWESAQQMKDYHNANKDRINLSLDNYS